MTRLKTTASCYEVKTHRFPIPIHYSTSFLALHQLCIASGAFPRLFVLCRSCFLNRTGSCCCRIPRPFSLLASGSELGRLASRYIRYVSNATDGAVSGIKAGWNTHLCLHPSLPQTNCSSRRMILWIKDLLCIFYNLCGFPSLWSHRRFHSVLIFIQHNQKLLRNGFSLFSGKYDLFLKEKWLEPKESAS